MPYLFLGLVLYSLLLSMQRGRAPLVKIKKFQSKAVAGHGNSELAVSPESNLRWRRPVGLTVAVTLGMRLCCFDGDGGAQLQRPNGSIRSSPGSSRC